VPYLINTARRWELLVRVVHNAALVQRAYQARRMLTATVDALRPWAARSLSPARETTALITALLGRDVDGYAAAHTELARTRHVQHDEHRCHELLTQLAKWAPTTGHPTTRQQQRHRVGRAARRSGAGLDLGLTRSPALVRKTNRRPNPGPPTTATVNKFVTTVLADVVQRQPP
jgi:hypothetical protein